jgi:hypothetical protein
MPDNEDAYMRLHLHVINDELARLGYQARLEKGKGYFFFDAGETTLWVERGVKVRKISELTLKQWIAEFRRLKELNEQILRTVRMDPNGPMPPPAPPEE